MIISNNIVNNNWDGIRIIGSYNLITNNIINYNDQVGISLTGISNFLYNNRLEECGILIWDGAQVIDTTNLVNGKPVYNFVNEVGLGPNDFLNAGQIILYNCQDVIISDLIMSDVTRGIALYYCERVTISNCVISNNILQGIMLYESSFNVLKDNILIANSE
ncbi:unnamed protein product, partial [marine sediment metagenome]